jgi:hypothetical protein
MTKALRRITMHKQANNHIFLFGSKNGVPFAEIYLGNGPVSAALKDLSKKHQKSGTMYRNLEGEIILQFPAQITAEFVSKVEGPFVMYNTNLTSAETVEAIRKYKGVSWSFWVHQDQTADTEIQAGDQTAVIQ